MSQYIWIPPVSHSAFNTYSYIQPQSKSFGLSCEEIPPHPGKKGLGTLFRVLQNNISTSLRCALSARIDIHCNNCTLTRDDRKVTEPDLCRQFPRVVPCSPPCPFPPSRPHTRSPVLRRRRRRHCKARAYRTRNRISLCGSLQKSRLSLAAAAAVSPTTTTTTISTELLSGNKHKSINLFIN